MLLGRWSEAEADCGRALVLNRRRRAKVSEAISMVLLGCAAWGRAERENAATALRTAQGLCDPASDRIWGQAGFLLALLLADCGDAGAAQQTLESTGVPNGDVQRSIQAAALGMLAIRADRRDEARAQGVKAQPREIMSRFAHQRLVAALGAQA